MLFILYASQLSAGCKVDQSLLSCITFRPVRRFRTSRIGSKAARSDDPGTGGFELLS